MRHVTLRFRPGGSDAAPPNASSPAAPGASRRTARVRLRAGLSALVAALGSGACAVAVDDRVLGVDATATVAAVVRVDADGDGIVSSPDPGVPGIRVRLLLDHAPKIWLSVPTDSTGHTVLEKVPVGRYAFEVVRSTVGDTVEILAVSRSRLTLGAGDSVEVQILLGYPRMTVAEARGAASNRRLMVEGVALNARNHFGDNTIHLTDGTAAIRMTRPGAVNVIPGDSIRVLGTRSGMDGQPTLDRISVISLGPGSIPVPRVATTAAAATAGGGELDAALVRVNDARVLDRSTTAAGYRLVVDDGTGPLVVQLDAVASFPFADYVLDAVLDVRGVLIPGELPGIWAIRPRAVPDVIILSVPDPDPEPEA